LIARATTRAVLAFAMVGAVGVVAPSAGAETGYRYWSYWNATDSNWTYATEGSGTRVPLDGALEGWRFGIAGQESFIEPSVPADFDAICAQQDQVEGSKRVAVVIDPGSPAQAPDGEAPGPVRTECVVAELNATGYQVLSEVVDVRTDAGFVCGLDGYPAAECAPLVEIPEVTGVDSPTDQMTDDVSDLETATTASVESTGPPDTGTPLLTAAVISLLALLGFGIWRRRRRSRSSRSSRSNQSTGST